MACSTQRFQGSAAGYEGDNCEPRPCFRSKAFPQRVYCSERISVTYRDLKGRLALVWRHRSAFDLITVSSPFCPSHSATSQLFGSIFKNARVKH